MKQFIFIFQTVNNEIGDDGGKAILEALKANLSIKKLSFEMT